MADDYGIKVSQDGYDIETCADYQLLFSSKWPNLKIGLSGAFTISDASIDSTIVTHNLGYDPVFWVFASGSYLNTGDNNSLAIGSGSAQSLRIDSTSLKFFGSELASPGTFSGYYYIFRQNMATTVAANDFSVIPAVAVGGTTYGFKVTKTGASTSSTDGRDFAIHSSFRSPQIHMAAQFIMGGSNTQVVNHNLGYVPLYFVYRKIDSSSTWYMDASDQENGVSADNTTLTIVSAAGSTFYYIIFKDPFNVNG